MQNRTVLYSVLIIQVITLVAIFFNVFAVGTVEFVRLFDF